MTKIDSVGFDNAALVSEEVATGEVVAYVGSRDFNYPEFGQKNIAGTPRSPGSSVKPYDYANLMKSSENWGAGSIFYDWKTELPGWGTDPSKQLTDYGNNPGIGPASMRYVLGNSKNIPAVKSVIVAGKGDGITGIRSMHRLMESMGVTSGFTNCGIDCDDIIATAIGDGGEIRLDEHVHGISTFSRMGKVVPQKYILKILDSKGKVILDNTKEPASEQALDPQIAYIINDMLSDGDASYFRSKSRAARDLAGYQDQTIPTAIKTGTTNNNENGWMVGYTPEFATAVWTGNHTNRSIRFEGMHFLTGPIWGQYMKLVYEKREVPKKWPAPDGIKTVTHDSTFFNIVKGACSGDRTCNYSATDIYPSWYTPRKQSSTQEKVKIDIISGKRATSCTPERAIKEVTGGGIVMPELDYGMPYYGEFLKPIAERLKSSTGDVVPGEKDVDDVHLCNDEKPKVNITMPASCNGSCTITATVSSGKKPLKNLYFKMDGSIMAGGSLDISSDGTYTFKLAPDTSGSHDFSAEVVDQLLYSETDSTTSQLTASSFNLDSANVTGANIKLTWDDISGSYTLGSSGGGNGNSLACSISNGKCTATISKSTLGSSGSYSISIYSTNPSRKTNSITVNI
jgi:membrane peptidoglycan carboxypeptidase